MKKIVSFAVCLFNVGLPSLTYAGFTFGDQNSGIALTLTSSITNYSAAVRPINGRIVKPTTSPIGGKPFYFQNGILSDGTFDIVLSATYDPSLTTSIILNGATGPTGASFYVSIPGKIPHKVLVVGPDNTMEGVPTFVNKDSIQFQGSSGTLDLGIQSELNAQIQLQSTINLTSDLTLADGIIIDGPGTINYNTFNLILGQKDLTWSHTLHMNNARNLVLNSDNRLKAKWVFDGDAHIVGNGFTLDLTNDGILEVAPNTKVRMTDLIIKGLGSGQIQLDDTTSELELYNVIFDMDATYTVTTGSWVAKGQTTAVVRNFFLKFENKGTLTVDRTTVYYDPLSFNDQNNITFESLFTNVASVNGGSIRKVRSLPIADFRISTNKELDVETVISPLKRLIFDETGEINGKGFDYRFARNPGERILYINPGKTAKFKNMLLKDYPVDWTFQSTDAQLMFGDQCTVEVGENATLNSCWFFDADPVLNGGGKTLTLGTSGEIVVRPGASLLIDNITIKGVNGNNIRVMDSCGTITFNNVTLKFDGDFTFTQGRFDVIGFCDLEGTYTFGYQTACTSTIFSRGTLYLDDGMTFSYAPPIPNRDLIQFEDELAIFEMSNSTLASTTTGMRITRGTLKANRHCYITQNQTAIPAISESIAIGNGNVSQEATVVIGPSAILEIISGRVFYDQNE